MSPTGYLPRQPYHEYLRAQIDGARKGLECGRGEVPLVMLQIDIVEPRLLILTLPQVEQAKAPGAVQVKLGGP